jgi:hypothetical protein
VNFGTYRCADLDVELARRIPVVHGIEGGDLVDTHWGHLQYPRDLVHDADAGEAVLALAKIEERHDGGLLVLGRIPGNNLLDELLVLRTELEGDARIVLRCIAVLQAVLVWQLAEETCGEVVHTTLSESLRAGRDTLKARH